MQVKKFLGDTLIIQIFNLLVKAIWILVIDRAVQNLLPATDYGQYFHVLSYSILFIIILDMGINTMNTREIAQNKSFFQNEFYHILLSKLILSIVFIGALFAVASLIGYSAKLLILLGAVAAFQVITSLNQFLRSNLAGLHKYKLDGILSSLDRLVVVLICGSMLIIPAWTPHLTIKLFVIIQIFGSFCVFIIASIINYKLLEKASFSFSLATPLRIIKQALPFAILAALMAIYTRTDVVMIAQLADEIEVSKYAMSYRLLDAANMVAVLFSAMLLPMFTKHLKDDNSISDIIKLGLKVLVLPGIIFVFTIALNAYPLMEWLYPQKVSYIAPYTMVLLILSFIPISVIYVFGTFLTAQKNLKFLNLAAAICVGLNVGLNYWLIPSVGIKGAAAATLLTQVVFAALCVTKGLGSTVIDIKMRIIFMHIISLLSLIFVIFWTKQFFENFLVHILFGGVFTAIYILVLNLSSLKKSE